MSKGVKLVLVIRQEIIVIPRAELTIVEGVFTTIRVRYNEPILNQQNENIVRGVSKDWSKRIHNVNKVPRPNFPHCTYCHQIRHRNNECPFIKDNVRQGFVEHFQNLNLEPARVGNHDILS
jgi:hypothetical protein